MPTSQLRKFVTYGCSLNGQGIDTVCFEITTDPLKTYYDCFLYSPVKVFILDVRLDVSLEDVYAFRETCNTFKKFKGWYKLEAYLIAQKYFADKQYFLNDPELEEFRNEIINIE